MITARISLFSLLCVCAHLSFANQDGLAYTGDSAFAEFRYAEAATAYQELLKTSYSVETANKLADTYFYWGLISSGKEKESLFLKGTQVMEEALSKQGETKNIETQVRLSRLLGELAIFRGGNKKIKMGKRVHALAMEVLSIDPDHAIGNAVIGIWNYERENLSGIESFFASLGGLPGASLEKSKSHLEKAVAADPTDSYFRYTLARTLIQVGATRRAKTMLMDLQKMPLKYAFDKITRENAKTLLETLH